MEKLCYSIDEACVLLSISRTHLYDLMNNGMLTFFKDGSRRYITKQSLEDYSTWAYETSSSGRLVHDE